MLNEIQKQVVLNTITQCNFSGPFESFIKRDMDKSDSVTVNINKKETELRFFIDERPFKTYRSTKG